MEWRKSGRERPARSEVRDKAGGGGESTKQLDKPCVCQECGTVTSAAGKGNGGKFMVIFEISRLVGWCAYHVD